MKRNPKDKEQGTSYTDNQHAQPNLSVSAAKVRIKIDKMSIID